ncbi:MAG: long-chain-acyl-CoA synthetase [Alphaproteobacteria bacterium]|nr:long-chain-acyl-CoA synthetase [Alphaproteobacteria bacterium]
MFQGLRREYTYITTVARTFWLLRHTRPDATRTLVDIVEGHAARAPDAPAVLFQGRTVSYRALDEGANRFAHWAVGQGVGRGDVVALFLENCPEYLMAWLGLLKIGAVAALINTNLKGAALAHSIAIVKARRVITGAELVPALAEAVLSMTPAPELWSLGGASGAFDLDAALAAASCAAMPLSARDGVTCKDNALFIYTSGTTGLPKAARFSHSRMLFMMCGFVGALRPGPRDRTYCTLPLYHATGGICSVGMALMTGGALIIKRRFSAHEFWDDCRRHRATFFPYIGELCRYLLNQPPDARDGVHELRAITGNGLRPEIWALFQKRFRIPRIVEFYGATEGNVAMLNYDGVVGAVGRIPRYARKAFPVRVVRFDVEHEAPVRGPDGFCIECDAGEPGEVVGQITTRPGRPFEGYTDQAGTEKKILRDVFAKGDAWFRTGDLLKRDALGYFYFVDRVGDTFRWKGENVATSEVAEALGVVSGIEEVNVYGVTVPGRDGRAGMAALVASHGFDPSRLAHTIAGNLPAFARPLFLRLRPEMEITGTFKLKKADLVKEGFDPDVIADPLYWLDPVDSLYKPLTRETYAGIVSGAVKL